MAKSKKKQVVDTEASEFKPRLGRIPIGRASQTFRDKSKYSRKKKHKSDIRRGGPEGHPLVCFPLPSFS